MYTQYTVIEEISQNLINEMLKLIFSENFCLVSHSNICKTCGTESALVSSFFNLLYCYTAPYPS